MKCMGQENDAQHKNAWVTVFGLVGGLLVVLGYASIGGLENSAVSAWLVFYTLVVACITIGLIGGVRLVARIFAR